MRLTPLILALALSTSAQAAPCPTGDTDGDTVPDEMEDVNGDKDCDNDDTDKDGIPNYKDPDDDNDKVPTRCERAYRVDYLKTDSDDDTIADLQEWDWAAFAASRLPDFSKCPAPQDTDSDRFADPLDDDDDGDGIDTLIEGTDDMDGVPPYDTPCATWGLETCDLSDPGDGLPNYLDLDSDGDGILDSEEAGDRDDDFIRDRVDCDDCKGPDEDPDRDGILSFFERDLGTDPNNPDSDGDGIGDWFEVRMINSRRWENLDSDGDRTPDALDTDDDGDGLLTTFEHANPDEFGDPAAATDTDGNGVADYLDNDDDGDGVLTKDEQADPNEDGDPADAIDQNEDGVPAYLDPLEPDTDKDGIPDVIEVSWSTDPDNADSDGDGLSDGEEWDWYAWQADGTADLLADPIDSDKDGTIDALDADDDNDGLSTKLEGDGDVDGVPPMDGPCEGWGDATCDLSTVGDGTPNHLDTDSDGDGNPDSADDGDTDEDGVVGYLDCDDCPISTIDDDPDDDQEVDGRCACTSGPAAGWFGLLCLPLLIVRRRR